MMLAVVTCLSAVLFGCASAPAPVYKNVSTIEPVLHHEHVPPADFEMNIVDNAAPKTPVIAHEPTKLRPMSLTRRAGE
jgi:hypothetical protein